jgi:hypothetical protein
MYFYIYIFVSPVVGQFDHKTVLMMMGTIWVFYRSDKGILVPEMGVVK